MIRNANIEGSLIKVHAYASLGIQIANADFDQSIESVAKGANRSVERHGQDRRVQVSLGKCL